MLKDLFTGWAGGDFKIRSTDAERLSDAETLGQVAEALETALDKLQSEYAGLTRRVNDVSAIASLVVGNESDEYLSREAERARSLHESEEEMKRGRERLRTLDQYLLNLRFLREAFLTRFPRVQNQGAHAYNARGAEKAIDRESHR
jgi:hypothetical protein